MEDRARRFDEPSEDGLPLDPEEALAREEEDAAAAEAGAIGGARREDGTDEAERPLIESGEGYAEGFEEAERELIEHATHGDAAPDPSSLAGLPEADRPDAEYGEADELETTERPDPGGQSTDPPP